MSRIIPSHWGHQSAFREEVQDLARAVFVELDPRLEPEVYLVGLVADHEDGIYPLFLDAPGDESSTELFQSAARRARSIRARLYEQASAQGEATDGDPKRRLVLEAWRQAVEESLAAHDRARDIVSFCSSPRPVKEFLVCTVLRLNRRVWGSYYALPKDEEDERARRPQSLLDATVQQFMRRCVVGLAERHSGLSASLVDADPEEILRAAGRLVTDAPALGGRHDLKLHGLWHACNTICSLRYEGAPSSGRLLLARPDHPGIQRRVTFRRPVRMVDHVATRKLLETHQPGYDLLSDGSEIHGLGTADPAGKSADFFQVTFLQQYAWELAYARRPLVRVSYGHPRLPEAALRMDRFRDLCARTFGTRGGKRADALWALAEAATRQPHGTLIVISRDAAAEVERLRQQAAPIEPRSLDELGVLALTSVDGAVLADEAGTVYGFSVILDGQATDAGNPARGARYNSAVRYVEASACPCLALVVSEDGVVDMVSTAERDGSP
jgi:hypothetical protein